jgi:hypothetical protein
VLSGTVVPEQGVYSLTSHERLVIFDGSTRKLSNNIMYQNGKVEEENGHWNRIQTPHYNMAWVGVGIYDGRRHQALGGSAEESQQSTSWLVTTVNNSI